MEGQIRRCMEHIFSDYPGRYSEEEARRICIKAIPCEMVEA